MNSCGVIIPHILEQFVEGDIEENISEYFFSEWYPLIKDHCYTPKSYIFDQKSLYDGTIDLLISQLPNNECFARFDTCSSKPEISYKSSKNIIFSLKKSDRTNQYFDNKMKIIIREWVYAIKSEFRCYVHDNNFRAITNFNLDHQYLDEIKNNVNKIRHYCDYSDFTVDFGLTEDNKIILIEINTPVYLCATSGNFDLNIPYDYEVLLGKYQPDIISYPVIR